MGRLLSTSPKRALIALLVGLVPGLLFVWPLIHAKWLEGAIPFGPGRSQLHVADKPTGEEVDVTTQSFVVTWSDRNTERPAPPLSLRIAPTEWYAWWSFQGARRKIPVTARGPEQLLLEVSVPGHDGMPPENVAPICLENKPVEACRLGRARLIVYRDDTDWDRQDILLGKRAPRSDRRVTADGRSLPPLLSYWTGEDKETGQERFLGWACDKGPQVLPLPPETGARPESLYRCFEPGDWWSRRWPEAFGFHKQAVLFDCDLNDHCEIAFHFRRRLVNLQTELLPAEDKERTRVQLWYSALAMLNRMNAQASQLPPDEGEVVQARTQIAACEAVAAVLADVPSVERKGFTQAASSRIDKQLLSCRQAAHIAARLGAPSAAVAESLLARAFTALSNAGAVRSEMRPWLEAWITTLQLTRQDQTPKALQASLLWLREYSRTPDGAPALVANTRALLGRFAHTLDEQRREAAYMQLAHPLESAQSVSELRALWEEWIATEAKAGGARGPGLLRPLKELAHIQWRAGEFDAMRTTIAQLQDVWFALPHPEDDAAKQRFGEGGASIVFLWKMVAFQPEGDPTTALASASEVVQRMRQSLDPTDMRARAAEQYLREIAARRTAAR